MASALRLSARRTLLSTRLHDNEWGVPCATIRKSFEMLCLEGSSTGLPRDPHLLRKREGYRTAFDAVDAEKMGDTASASALGDC